MNKMIKTIQTKDRKVELLNKVKEILFADNITLKAIPMRGKWIYEIVIDVDDMTEEELLRCCD